MIGGYIWQQYREQKNTSEHRFTGKTVNSEMQQIFYAINLGHLISLSKRSTIRLNQMPRKEEFIFSNVIVHLSLNHLWLILNIYVNIKLFQIRFFKLNCYE